MCKVVDLLLSICIIGFICLLLFIYYEEASNTATNIFAQIQATFYGR